MHECEAACIHALTLCEEVVIGPEQTLFTCCSPVPDRAWPLGRLFQDNDLLDKRKHCFSVQTESGEDMFFSVELDGELLIWEKAFQTATFLEVERIQVRRHGDVGEVGSLSSSYLVSSSRPVPQCKTYACIMESHLMGLTVDFSMGFVCFDAASKVGVRRSSAQRAFFWWLEPTGNASAAILFPEFWPPIS